MWVDMKQIDISTKTYPDIFALVDDGDYEYLSKYRWRAQMHRKKFYAVRSFIANGKYVIVQMHTQITGGSQTDHINLNGLDNTRINLRLCTNAQNQWNKPLSAANTSGYKGVSWHKKRRRWGAQIGANSKQYWLGSFSCPIKAARAYDEAAKKHHGEFARLNFK